MAVNSTKFFYPPTPGNGAGTFDDIVGFQIVEGGGLTSAVFDFTTTVTEKVNRTFSIGTFSNPISLEDLDVNSLEESRRILQTQFRVYPNYDVSQVLNFSLYGSLAKRLSVSVTHIINYFPAGVDVRRVMPDFTTGQTATGISYNAVEQETTFTVPVSQAYNPFMIEFSQSATTAMMVRELETSQYRNLTRSYLNYVLDYNGETYIVVDFEPSVSQSSGNLVFTVSGAPFGNATSSTTEDFIIRPSNYIVDKVFQEDFDEVEQFLMNRLIQPEYTANFQVPQQNQAGQFYTSYVQVTFPKDGDWNLDITSFRFDNYLARLGDVAGELDTYKTNLISRFLVTASIKEFDTMDQKVEKILQIYGRSFDQIKQYIDALANMNSVHYVPQNDIPSQLLFNLSQTLGWTNNFSPITNEDFLSSVFGNTSQIEYPGFARAQTPTELNYQFYRNLILNSAYLFKSKGTRRSIEFLLRLIGAPEALIEFNEHIYLADQRIDMTQFDRQFAQLSGGTYVNEIPALSPGNTFSIRGQIYTAYTTSTTYEAVNIRRNDYPVDEFGWPQSPNPAGTNGVFFQEGAGWYESTPQHRSPNEVTVTGDVFTGQNVDVQTQLEPFTYGGIYLDRFNQFPYIQDGYKLQRVPDNKKSWLATDDKLRIDTQEGFNAYYFVSDEKLVLNVKNIDLFLNVGQGLAYDVWEESRLYNYPIPESGFTANFPSPGGIDDTFINPEPQKKTFFEFYQTFWQNMINTRNRMYISDGKTGGYPTLQSVFWKYIQSEQTVGLPNNKYTYQKLIEYVDAIGPYWMTLVEQMIPATTLWNTGVRLENSIFQKQKFVYRRQRGCQLIPVEAQPCFIISNIFDYDCNTEYVDFFIYPWLNGDVTVSDFQSILTNRVNNYLTSVGANQNSYNPNSISSQWYLNLTIGTQTIIDVYFYQGSGISDVPTSTLWRQTLIDNLNNLYQYGYTYTLNGNFLTITNLDCVTQNSLQEVSLDVGINITLDCPVIPQAQLEEELVVA
jgi:hypothetical protein